jgi:hypothetical protein
MSLYLAMSNLLGPRSKVASVVTVPFCRKRHCLRLACFPVQHRLLPEIQFRYSLQIDDVFLFKKQKSILAPKLLSAKHISKRVVINHHFLCHVQQEYCLPRLIPEWY